jgi:hypothetical protein
MAVGDTENNFVEIKNQEDFMLQNVIEQNKKEMNFFDCISKISDINKQADGLNDLFFDFARPYLDFLCDILRISQTGAAIFAGLIDIYDGCSTSINEISKYLHIKCIELIEYMDELEFLAQNGLIYINRGDNHRFGSSNTLFFELRFEAIDALKNGKHCNLKLTKNLSIDDFFIHIEHLCEDRVQGRTPYKTTMKNMDNLLKDNEHLNFVRKIQKLELPNDDLFILLRFFHYTVTNGEPDMDFHALSVIYEHRSDFTPVKRSLERGQHILLRKELIENTCNDGFSNNTSFRLTEKVKDDFLIEMDVSLSELPEKGLIRANSISEKKLYYPEKTQQKIDELISLLQPDYFQDIQKRLSDSGTRTGFACLFSGGPGTGKTETAYQVARISGRDIVQVDISAVKSKWFGDSEKQIKSVFDKYRTCVKKSKVTPILLFNEADAIISKRRILGDDRSGPDQTENTIQNIILQEIEKLNGILIATTNLSNNMDKAFERRFLYKIDFEKPDAETRKSIWRSLINSLSDEDAGILSSRFDFSGGQIENISRKTIVHQVLSGKAPGLDDLIKFCNEECLKRDVIKIIGFAA